MILQHASSSITRCSSFQFCDILKCSLLKGIYQYCDIVVSRCFFRPLNLWTHLIFIIWLGSRKSFRCNTIPCSFDHSSINCKISCLSLDLQIEGTIANKPRQYCLTYFSQLLWGINTICIINAILGSWGSSICCHKSDRIITLTCSVSFLFFLVEYWYIID